MDSINNKPVFLTGASGYIGGRLLPRLLDAGYKVRCLARFPEKLKARSWAQDENVEIIEGSADDEALLERSLRGCGAAYYMIHSMIVAGRDYHQRDIELAAGFRRAAENAGIDRIIYLGGLGETGPGLSRHLASRREVEKELSSGSVPVTIFRAAMVIGSGSASFEILRYLVERLPVMITPRWVNTRCQPIAIRNVLNYLTDCLEKPETTGMILDIGGPDILTYKQLMRLMAEIRKLPKRLIVPVPVLTPRLSSLWINLVTPVGHRIARPLAEGLKNEVVCRNNDAVRIMPQDLLTAGEAISRALGKMESDNVETAWRDAGTIPGDPDWAGGTVFEDSRKIGINASKEVIFRAVCKIGGGHGYYTADILWKIRGFIDRLVGGPGLRRGRRNPETVEFGEPLDFWRVTGVVPGKSLKLRAEMKLPGEALLEFSISESMEHSGKCFLVQTARFIPKGLMGLLYWYAILPVHNFVFRGMLKGIKHESEKMVH